MQRKISFINFILYRMLVRQSNQDHMMDLSSRKHNRNFGRKNVGCSLHVVYFLLGNSPSSEFYMPTFRNTLFHLHRQVVPMKMEQYSEMLAYKIQTPGNCPEENIQHSEHSESLKSSLVYMFYAYIYIYIYIYTGCPRRNVPDFGRVFLMFKYTDIIQNTYIQS